VLGDVLAWLQGGAHRVHHVTSSDELLQLALRGHPRVAVFDARQSPELVLAACKRLKSDSYTAVVPAIVVAAATEDAVVAALAAGADEVVTERTPPSELTDRLHATLRRSDRDVQVHPSTRLPGATSIEAEIERRLAEGGLFAVCYADLDHFKEFNDRYGYYEGNRVIQVVAKILHDVVKGLCGESGFVGHIGGDDFIFMLDLARMQEACAEIVAIFDALAPYQYSDQDRRAGYFFGKDRRGQLHRVPLMSLSIGVVTNERRQFNNASQVSALATEMKSYAKTLEGSVFSLDRRQGPVEESPGITPERGIPARQGGDR
jgi:GGDEF domain-containing protein